MITNTYVPNIPFFFWGGGTGKSGGIGKVIIDICQKGCDSWNEERQANQF